MRLPRIHFVARAGLVTVRRGGHCNGRQWRPQRSFPEGGEKYETPRNGFARRICQWQPGESTKQRAFARCRQYTTPWACWQGVDGTSETSSVTRIDGGRGAAGGLRTYPVRYESAASLKQPGRFRGVPAIFHFPRTRPRARPAIIAGKPATQTKGTSLFQTGRNQRSEKAGAVWPWPLSPQSLGKMRPR